MAAELKVDWATHEATKHACENWHYSGCLPTGKLVKVGAWEDGRFIGVVIFSRGAAPNIGKPYGLPQTEVCELTRVAMRDHTVPVTQVVAVALKFLRRTNPGMKLVVSYADPMQGHHGGIYQAGNWIYTGAVPMRWIRIHGKLTHPRSLYAKYGTQSVPWLRANVDPSATWEVVPDKHKYLMPLDKATKRRMDALAKPYPPRVRPDA